MINLSSKILSANARNNCLGIRRVAKSIFLKEQQRWLLSPSRSLRSSASSQLHCSIGVRLPECRGNETRRWSLSPRYRRKHPNATRQKRSVRSIAGASSNNGSNEGSSRARVMNTVVREWAVKNPEAARDALRVPPLPSSPSSSISESPFCDVSKDGTMEGYLKWRNWNQINTDDDTQTTTTRSQTVTPSQTTTQDDHDHDNVKHKANQKEEDAIHSDTSLKEALVSHVLTFPLTLASNAHHFYPPNNTPTQTPPDEDKNEDEDTLTIRLCCIGARAEATLPHDYWREFLLACDNNNNPHHHNHAPEGIPATTVRWIIDFVGPDVPRALAEDGRGGTVHLPPPPPPHRTDHRRYRHRSLETRYHRSTLHHLVRNRYRELRARGTPSSSPVAELRGAWDGYVLFNPGIGHPALRKSWEATLRFVLGTGRRVVLTAHSDIDGRRDREVLAGMLGLDDGGKDSSGGKRRLPIGYVRNPFACRQQWEDRFPVIDGDACGAGSADTCKTTDCGSKDNGDSSISEDVVDDADQGGNAHHVSPNHSVLIY